jgi:DNA-directed RNA polymerase specialized sigma24 family protein
MGTKTQVAYELEKGRGQILTCRSLVQRAERDLRRAIIAARDEGWTVQAIANALGWSRPNVYAFMAKGKK